MIAKTIALQCPQCSSTETVDSRVVHFGCEFKCKHCKTTSVLVIHNKLRVRAAGEHVCGACGLVASAAARFCQCGASLIKKCPWCHKEILIDHSICDQCGRPAAIDPKSQEGYALQENEALAMLNSGNDESIFRALNLFHSIEISSAGKEKLIAFIEKQKPLERAFHVCFAAKSYLSKLGSRGLELLAELPLSAKKLWPQNCRFDREALDELVKCGEVGMPYLLKYVTQRISTEGRSSDASRYLYACGSGAVPLLIEFLKLETAASQSWDSTNNTLIYIGRPALPALKELTGFWQGWFGADAKLKARALDIISKIEAGA